MSDDGFSTDQMSHLAEVGHSLPGGRFKIRNRAELRMALAAYNKAPSETAKKHIIARASALRAEDLLPHDWIASQHKAANPDDDRTSAVAQARDALRRLAALEAAEMADGNGGPGPVQLICGLLEQLDWYDQADDEDDVLEAAKLRASALHKAMRPTITKTARRRYRSPTDIIKSLNTLDPETLRLFRQRLWPDTDQLIEALNDIDQRLARLEVTPEPIRKRAPRPQPSADSKRLADLVVELESLQASTPAIHDLAHRKANERRMEEIRHQLRHGGRQ